MELELSFVSCALMTEHLYTLDLVWCLIHQFQYNVFWSQMFIWYVI